MLPLPAGTDFGIYTLLDTLGHGGFAFVYLAQDKQLGRRVCIKEHAPQDICRRDAETGEIVPLPGLERAFAGSLADFRQEAEVLAALRHPQVPSIHEIFESGGTAYVVTDYAEGSALPQWLTEAPERRRQLPFLLESALRILQSLHREGVLHRDIKPAHLIIDAAGGMRLVDFGAAVPAGARHAPVFTPPYSPPEQNMQGTAGAWSDLYSLAASFRSVLLQEPLQEAMQRLEEDNLHPLADDESLQREFPLPFLRSLDRALSLLPEERFESAGAWLANLAETRRPRSSVRRHAIMATLAAALLAAAALCTYLLYTADADNAAVREQLKQLEDKWRDTQEEDPFMPTPEEIREQQERMLRFVEGAPFPDERSR
ncbi:MAG: serine/threonine-protein kinase [Akkermansia sp.]|nr:serine/threonine-protein kinase [Akkermansia sp.]